MKRNGFTLIELMVIVAIFVLLSAILFPVFFRTRGCGPSCSDKLKRMGLALVQYQADYDVFPRVAATGSGYGWGDALNAYTKSQFAYWCPVEGEDGQNDPRKSGYTDYWFNGNLSGVETKKLASPAQMVSFGDGNYKGDLTDARYSLFALPQTWMDDKESPAYRHNGGANYSFADGHVKMLKPEQTNQMFTLR
jgi:prepilin-type processing-associated H-X9-DG protein/prepilin-type N-terminal cleavage/methylation domain-containing protein